MLFKNATQILASLTFAISLGSNAAAADKSQNTRGKLETVSKAKKQQAGYKAPKFVYNAMGVNFAAKKKAPSKKPTVAYKAPKFVYNAMGVNFAAKKKAPSKKPAVAYKAPKFVYNAMGVSFDAKKKTEDKEKSKSSRNMISDN